MSDSISKKTTTLRDIKWYGHFPLSSLKKKIHELKPSDIEDDKKKILLSHKFKFFLDSMSCIYNFIGFIMQKLDDNISKALRESFPSQIYNINIDVYSLVLFSHILMDKIPYLVDYLVMGETKPKIKNFTSFKKEILKCKGEKIDELIEIINRTNWYEQLDFIRDKAVVHKGQQTAELGRTYDQIGIYFHWYENNELKEKFFTIEDIRKLAIDILIFLNEINDFFYDKFYNLPLYIQK